MKKLLLFLPLVFLLCFTFGCQKAEEVVEEPAVDIEAERGAVREAFLAQAKAGPAKDVELVMSYVADDAFQCGVGDKEAIREMYADYFSQGRYWNNTTVDKVEVSASGDLAYVIASWENFRDEEGETSTGKGSNLFVLKKQADGTWKIVAF
jgi:ketosteroid isomerase-like protein